MAKAETYLKGLTYEFKELDGQSRLRELILYIADKCLDDPTYGSVKLSKILYFSDFLSYARTGKPITGVPYVRMDRGYVPKPFLDLRDEMETEGDIVVAQNRYGSFPQKRIVARKPANLEKFSARDIALIDSIIQWLWGKTARDISAMSHDRAWKATDDKALIPYEAVFISDEELTEYDVTRSLELVQEYGWDV